MHVWYHSTAGLYSASPAKGCVQARSDQLFGTDQRQPDSEHHPLQAGQEEEGRVWTTPRVEDCECTDRQTDRCVVYNSHTLEGNQFVSHAMMLLLEEQ